MSLHRVGAILGVLMVAQFSAVVGAVDQPTVRVVDAEAKVFERPTSKSRVAAVALSGAVLEVVDKERDWYWILLERDENGTRRTGWIQARHVEIAVQPTPYNSLRGLTGVVDDATTASEPPQIDDREAKQAAKKAEEEARAQARVEAAARKVEEARREVEALRLKVEGQPIP